MRDSSATYTSSSGPGASFERGSARHSGAQRTSPVAGSRPWNIARTLLGAGHAFETSGLSGGTDEPAW
jgi:hypothetical protein